MLYIGIGHQNRRIDLVKAIGIPRQGLFTAHGFDGALHERRAAAHQRRRAAPPRRLFAQPDKSLFRPINSLLRQCKFPVNYYWEYVRNSLISLDNILMIIAKTALFFQNSLINSLFSGNW